MINLATIKINKLITQQSLWLLIILIYAGIVISKAAQEHDYIYDSKHYENVMKGLSKDYRDIYYGQKCNSFDPTSGEPDPICRSLRTIDEGVMLFDITTPKAIADHIVDEYNKVAFKYVVISTLKFYSFFLLLWLAPSIIFYPFFEWFLDGYNKDIEGSRVLSGIRSNNGATVNKVESLLKRYFIFLEGKGKVFNLALGAAFSTLFGIFDIISPEKYSFIMIYIFPIALTTWFAGQSAGFVITVICIIFWSLTNQQSDLMAFSCNILSTLCIYFIISIMLTKLRSMWEHETVLSRTDQLTGVMNRRAFEEIVRYEILSLQRQNSPFSLAYLDLDNFKEVNDNFGHKIGDELLKAVVVCLKENLRRTDVIARMGGDEFTIFFPATDQSAVKLVMQKLQEQLIALNDMNNWPTTISIGVATSVDSKCDLETSISLADKLMYEVKNKGKNDINYMTIPLGM
jgi:diguanylate cyclase (GGDEF)-like protein